MDFFVVPTIGFDLLYAFVIVGLARRELVWINVTRNPTAAWVAGQITEAFLWEEAPGYTIYGGIVTRRLLPWAFGTSLSHQPRLRRTDLPNG